MARKTRNQKRNNLVTQINTDQLKKYRTAVYYRLSKKNNGTNQTDTIENQAKIVENYIKGQPDLIIYKEYIENGQTGITFNRPVFNELIEDVKAGLIDCIVVKDLSRLGRNHIETSNYIEKIFPTLDIRFISVTENFDTLTAERNDTGFIIPLKNILNDLYAKDLSKKIIPVIRKKQEEGYFIGNHAYGYLKSKTNKGKLIIDERTAPVVVLIYKLRCEGMTYSDIAKELNNQNILTPSQYLYKIGLKKNPPKQTEWKYSSVKNILSREIYTGDMVQGYTKQALYRGQEQIRKQKDELIRVKGTHEAIINRETFEKAQEINRQTREKYLEGIKANSKYEKTENKYYGKILCGCCGSKFKRVRSVRNDKVTYRLLCSSRYRYSDIKCKTLSITENKLDKVMLQTIKKHIKVLVEEKKILDMIMKSKEYEIKYTASSMQLENLQTKLDKNTKEKNSLYGNYVLNKISKEEYERMKKEYISTEQVIKKEIQKLRDKMLYQHKAKSTKDTVIKKIKQLTESNKLTKKIVDELVENIVIYNNQRIKINFRFKDEYKKAIKLIKDMEVVI